MDKKTYLIRFEINLFKNDIFSKNYTPALELDKTKFLNVNIFNTKECKTEMLCVMQQ